jgi:enoyl-[acyl-carrier protein] reductase III
MAILVTGGSTGIGRGIALRFATSGDAVFINYNSNDGAARETAELIERAGGTAHLIKQDVGSIAGARAVIEDVRRHVDHLDQIVHCAAKPVSGNLTEVVPEDVEKSVAVNGMALLHIVREALPLLGRGSCVFYITSRGGRMVVPNYGAMGIPKALGDQIARYLAVELAGRGIRVNIISPGALDTPALRACFPDTYKERLRMGAEANPSGRGLEFDDVADVVERMSRPEFSMVQGQYISIDGGNSL